MFYWGTLLRTLAHGTASQRALRNCSIEVREESRYTGIFAEKNELVTEGQKITTTKNKTRHLKLMILVLFCAKEDVGVWAH